MFFENNEKTIEEGEEICIGVFIDLRAAFDIVEGEKYGRLWKT